MSAERDRTAIEVAVRMIVGKVLHDLRTPLFALTASVETAIAVGDLGDGDSVSDIRERVDELCAAMADYQEKAAGMWEPVPVSVGALIEDVLRGAREMAAGRSVQLDVKVHPPSLEMSANRAAVALALGEILANAVRYSPAGGTVEITAEAANGVLVRVCDRGGPSPLASKDWFAVFQSSEERLGLGLTIAREVVLAHGGSIRVSQRPGGGTLIELTFPG